MPIDEGIDPKIVAEASGSRASSEKPAGAATNTTTNSNTTKMSSTLDHVTVRHLTSRHGYSDAYSSYGPPSSCL